MDSKKYKIFLPRDISWMYFNHRILQEARRDNVPLLERLMFLGIYSNNLDEFFRVRVATQSRIAECEDKEARKNRKEAETILKGINKLNNKYSKEFELAISEITEKLREENIFILKENEVDDAQREYIRKYYLQNLCGLITPIWFSAVKHLDLENDENIFLAIRLTRETAKKHYVEYAFLEIPVNSCGRFVRLPDKEGKRYLMYLDDVIRCSLPLIFCGLNYSSYEAFSFKFTRDAEMEIDNDLRNGMLEKISKGVKSRKRGEPLRIVYDSTMPKALLKLVLSALCQDRLDTVLAGGRYHNHKDFMKFPDCGRKDLKYPAWPPILKSELSGSDSILEQICLKDRFIHVPYHSFDSYIRILQEAAIHKDVKSIKTTLYRLAKGSKVVKALIGAARNGKKVTVVIELLARFDEASNINWSKEMQDAGIHVIFGVEGLKVHSKLTHITMKKGADIACISTGNFHEGNAKSYTDYLLMTAAPTIVREVHSVFDFIERPYSPHRFKELFVSPNEMKSKFLRLINDEIKNKAAGKPAYIHAKVNHITDTDMIKKLYEAAEQGVPIELLVRGNCSIDTTQPILNGNIKIRGIIDRYLEHSRIFIFAAGGKEKVFIGSADWMTRNLENRIEVIAPVYDLAIKEDLKQVVRFGLSDTQQARIVEGRGDDRLEERVDIPAFRSQEALYKYYSATEAQLQKQNNTNEQKA